MARDFSKNSSNYMSLGTNAIGALINGFAAVSFAVWTQLDALDASSLGNRWIHANIASTTGLTLCTDVTGTHLVVGGRSGTGDTFQSKTTTGVITVDGVTWVHLGGVIDFTNKTVTPYISGVADNGGSVTFANNTFVNGSHTTDIDMIGGNGQSGPPPATVTQPDGRIAEVALWVSDIGPANMLLLASAGRPYIGYSPKVISPSTLKIYFQLRGFNSPEKDDVSNLSGTITGSIPTVTDHPFIVFSATPTESMACNGRRMNAGGMGQGDFI